MAAAVVLVAFIASNDALVIAVYWLMVKIKLTAEENGEIQEFDCEEKDMVTALEKVALFATTMIQKIDPERWESRMQEGVKRRNKLN
jgi:hypothetical protein